jgi:hypothetical protein
MASEVELISRLLKIDAPVDTNGTSLVYDKQEKLNYPWLKTIGVKSGIRHNLNAKVTNGQGIVPLGKSLYGSDDYTYNLHPKMGRTIPRGYSIVEFTMDDNTTKYFHIHGFYKFGSRQIFDEDSDISCNVLIKDSDVETADRCLLTRKENGKMAIISMFKLGDEIIILGGSKNQHYLLRLISFEEDLMKILSIETNFATQILWIFFCQWCKMDFETQEKLRDYLLNPDQTTTRTLCGEFLDGKHMVALKDGEPETINWFGFIDNRGPINDDVKLCDDFEQSMKLLHSFSLPSVSTDIILKHDFTPEFQHCLRWQHNVEGYVIHWQKKMGDIYLTVAMEKFKTWWYVIIRMVREFLNNKHGTDQGWQVALLKRMIKRNKNYMKLDNRYIWLWYELSCKFIDWFIDSGYDKSQTMFAETSDGMGNMWNKFLKETSNSDDFSDSSIIEKIEHVNLDEKLDIISKKYLNTFANFPAKGILIILQGVTGLGKSTLSYSVRDALSEYTVVPLEQDTYVAKWGLHKAGVKCFEECSKLMKHISNPNVIILARNNSNYSQYGKYVDLANDNNYYVVIVAPRDYFDIKFGLTCLQSTMRRKTGSSISNLPMEKQFQITMAFLASLKEPSVSEKINEVFWLDWLQKEFPIPSLSVLKYYQEYYGETKKYINPFDVPTRNLDEIITGLELDKSEYSNYRIPVLELTKILSDKIKQLLTSPLFVKKPQISKYNFYGILLSKKSIETLYQVVTTTHGSEVAKLIPLKIKKPWLILYDPIFNSKKYSVNSIILNTKVEIFIVGVIYDYHKQIIIFNCTLKNTKNQSLDHLVASKHPIIIFDLEPTKSDIHYKEAINSLLKEQNLGNEILVKNIKLNGEISGW